MNSYYVYFLSNYTNSVLYIGVTNNLERRVQEHRNGGNVSSFAKRYRLYKLLWFQEFTDVTQAIEVEKRLKGWKREKKLTLIREMNPRLLDLGGKKTLR